MPLVGRACRLEPRVGISAGFLGALLTINRWAETKGSYESGLAGLGGTWPLAGQLRVVSPRKQVGSTSVCIYQRHRNAGSHESLGTAKLSRVGSSDLDALQLWP